MLGAIKFLFAMFLFVCFFIGGLILFGISRYTAHWPSEDGVYFFACLFGFCGLLLPYEF